MASSSASLSKLVLEPNVPQKIALRYPTGKIVESRFKEEKEVYYSLVDGRAAYLSLGVSQSINNLQLGNGEEFWICKRWNGDRRQQPRYDVWLTPEGEKIRAMDQANPQPEQPSLLERQLAASIHEAQQRKQATSAPAPPPPQGTGTNGPVAVPQRVSAAAAQLVASAPQLQAWGQNLLAQTNQLIDVYALACQHAETQGVPNAVVRTVMLSAFIGLQRKGGA